jgi:hypothetical protein
VSHEGRQKSGLIFAVLLVAVLAACTGCKNNKEADEDYLGDIRTNTMTVSADGSILEIACEDFTGVTYDISGLEDTIRSEVEDYRTKCGETEDDATVKLLQYDNSDGFVRVAIEYADLTSYNKFNNTSYTDGLTSSVASDMKLTDLGGNEVVMSDITDDGYKAFTIDGEYTLKLNGSVLYYNANATKGSDGSTVITDGLGTAVIIYR